MTEYNLFSATDFAALVQREPREILKLMLEISESSRLYPDQALLVPFTSIPTEVPTNVHMRDFGSLFVGDGLCRRAKLPSMEMVNKRIRSLMPFSSKLNWDGYVAAGSFAALVCQGTTYVDNDDYMSHRPGDVDFYPYCYPKDRKDTSLQDAIMIKYINFLAEIDAISISTYDNKLGHMLPICESIFTKRSTNCTTITMELDFEFRNSSYTIKDYQFIHRAYSSPTSVVVGFDLLACKAFYDGKMVYFTLDAALCLYFGINPVDWRRESPSHMHRIRKYCEYGYCPIFPGLTLDLAKELSERTGYYLPKCQLFKATNQYETIAMQFNGVALDHLIAGRQNPQLLQDKEWLLWNKQFNYTCLNLEDVPDMPFSRNYEESDYDVWKEGISSHNHHLLTTAVRKKYSLLYVYCDGNPLQIVTDPQETSVRQAMMAVLDKETAPFYLGTSRVTELDAEIKTYVIRKHGVPALKLEKHNIIEARIKELEAAIEPYMAKLRGGVEFITSKPGAQFTGCFKPIIRQTPRDYWGSRCVPFEPSRLYRMKMTLLCIRRYYDPILRQLDRHVVQIIFFHLSNAYFQYMATDSSKDNPRILSDRLGL